MFWNTLHCIESLLPGRSFGTRDEDRRRRADLGILPQCPTDVDAARVGEADVDEDRVGRVRECSLEAFAARVGTHDRHTVRLENALQRSGRPLLVVDDENDGWTGAGALGH